MSSTDLPKKHPCHDCRFCQWCGDDRCSLCLGGRKRGEKLSLAEQIELFERVNRGDVEGAGCGGCPKREKD